MFKKFLQGLIFGAGFSIALVVVYSLWICWVIPKYLVNERVANFSKIDAAEVKSPPAIPQRHHFLGTPGIYDGNFERGDGVLAAGEGQIRGSIHANGEPIEGLRIRLALNGSVMSQWGKSDKTGIYVIPVPYGTYRIDGYELDNKSADASLPGKIDHPRNPHTGATFEVSSGKPGEGLILNYVDPVIKLSPKGEVSSSKNIVAKWEAYPGAHKYVVQIYKNENLHDFVGDQSVFNWRDRPVVSEPMINLSDQGTPLKSGFYYTLEITAEDEKGNAISKTARQITEKDFKIID